MLIKLDFESEIPIYQQLKDQIVMGIAVDDLEPGESLPSVRELASDLGVNLHTIRKSYNQLKTEGFVHVNRRKGAIVANLPIALDDDQKQLLDNGLNTFIATLICSGKSHEEIRLKIDSILDRMIERK